MPLLEALLVRIISMIDCTDRRSHESVINMHVGDKYHLVFGGNLVFGQKERSSGDDGWMD